MQSTETLRAVRVWLGNALFVLTADRIEVYNNQDMFPLDKGINVVFLSAVSALAALWLVFDVILIIKKRSLRGAGTIALAVFSFLSFVLSGLSASLGALLGTGVITNETLFSVFGFLKNSTVISLLELFAHRGGFAFLCGASAAALICFVLSLVKTRKYKRLPEECPELKEVKDAVISGEEPSSADGVIFAEKGEDRAALPAGEVFAFESEQEEEPEESQGTRREEASEGENETAGDQTISANAEPDRKEENPAGEQGENSEAAEKNGYAETANDSDNTAEKPPVAFGQNHVPGEDGVYAGERRNSDELENPGEEYVNEKNTYKALEPDSEVPEKAVGKQAAAQVSEKSGDGAGLNPETLRSDAASPESVASQTSSEEKSSTQKNAAKEEDGVKRETSGGDSNPGALKTVKNYSPLYANTVIPVRTIVLKPKNRYSEGDAQTESLNDKPAPAEKRSAKPSAGGDKSKRAAVKKKNPAQGAGAKTASSKTESARIESAERTEKKSRDNEPVIERQAVASALPLTKRHIIMNRMSVVNMFSDYLANKNKNEAERLEESISTIIIK